jgi:hypothetical protein
LQYALTLEHLEDFFYQNFLGQFSQEDFAAAGQPEWISDLHLGAVVE